MAEGTAADSLDLTPFVPRALWQGANDASLAASWSRSFRGVTLLADISGFTSLSERLARRGVQGAEELAHRLDQSFGPMVQVIDRYGGDIVRFAGDAPIVVWPAGGDSLSTALEAAIGCGDELLSLVEGNRRPAGLQLAMRIGVGAGPLWAASVGGAEDRWEFVLLGEPLHAMGRAERCAAPGEMVLAPEAVQWLDASIAVAPLDDGSARLRRPLPGRGVAPMPTAQPTPTPPSTDGLRPFVSRSLVRQLEAGHGDWLAEYRPISVLFAGLEGIEDESSEAAGTLQQAFSTLQRAVYELGGSVNQFLVDDKGITLLALWGVPGRSHEDNARRATEAALAMDRRIRRLGLRVGVGVTSGRVFCGRRGGSSRSEYAVIGATVNLAARLMSQAQGSVLCDETTAREVGDALTFEPLAPLVLKGRAEATAVLRPMPTSSSRRFRSSSGDGGSSGELVGRGPEVDRFDRRLDRLDRGLGRSIELRGRSGVGKTVLLEEFVRRAGQRDLPVFQARCDSFDRARPYGIWAALVDDALELPAPVDDAAREARGREVVRRLEELGLDLELAALLNPILDLRVVESSLVGQMGRDVRRDAIRELMLDWMTAAIEDQSVVLVDDCQWLDEASRRLARDLARRLPHCLFLLVGRDDATAEASDDREDVEPWTLDPLRPAALLEVVRRTLDARRLPRDLEDLMVARTEGNPLFARELSESLVASGVLAVHDGVCRVLDHAALAAQSLPDSVQGVIASRLDRLSPEDQLILKVAAVLGNRFPAVGVSSAHPVEEDERKLKNRLQELVDRGFLEAEDDSYRFSQSVARDVVYGRLMPTQKRQLHGAVARWLESRSSSQSPSLLARHWQAAGNRERSIHYLALAADEAVRSGAERQAAVAYRRALELVADGDDEPALQCTSWRRELGHALFALGEIDEAEGQLRRALAEVATALPSGRAGWVARLGRESVRQALHRVIPPRARAELEPRWERPLEAARLMGLVGKLSFYRDQPLPFVTASLAAVNLAEKARRPQAAAAGYAALGYLAAILGLERTAERWWQTSETSGDTRARIDALISRGLFAFGECRWDDCDGHIEQALSLAERTRDAFSRESALAVRVYRLHHTARFEESLAAGEALLDSAVERSSAQREMWGRLSVVGDLLVLGREDEALGHLEVAADLFPDSDQLSRLTYRGLRTRAFAWTGDWRAFGVELERLQQQTADSSVSYALAPMLAIQGEGELLSWQRASGERDSRSLRRILLPTLRRLDRCARSFPYARLSALKLRRDYWRARGNPRKAGALQQAATKEALRIGLGPPAPVDPEAPTLSPTQPPNRSDPDVN